MVLVWSVHWLSEMLVLFTCVELQLGLRIGSGSVFSGTGCIYGA